MKLLSDLIQELPGYKIADSHFRIGSKIHISNFYYAKRFFQNSFFASRFAYLLAREILSDFGTRQSSTGPVKSDILKSEGLTLIGYGIYSELLLSLTVKFIKALAGFPEEKITHNIFRDNKELKLAKNKRPHKNILLIVPIASTFSTAVKMEEKLKNDFDCVVHNPHYNLLHVFGDANSRELKLLEEEFGWIAKYPDKREIHLKAFYEQLSDATRVQKYFIRLPTKWERILNCNDCFPSTPTGNPLLLDEKPLFETDRTAITPSLIFEVPKANTLDNNGEKQFKLIPEMIQYGLHPRNQSHFLYNIDTELFLAENLEEVTAWLSKLKEDQKFSKEFSELQNILIISSGHYSNATFINLVNEVLFSWSANIIHYDPTNDYIQNFDMIYGQEISMADKIIFVDDALRSGKTFSKIEEFARHTIHLRKSRATSSKINRRLHKVYACIFLLNNSQPYIYEKVKKAIVKETAIHAFTNLNLFTSLSHDEESPLLLEQQKYSQLSKISILDNLRAHFEKQKGKLSTENIPNRTTLSNERHLKMLEATHRLYSYFTQLDCPPTFNTFDLFVADLMQRTAFYSDYKLKKAKDTGFKVLHACILKVLAQLPFTQYEPLKKMVFKWVVKILYDHVENMIRDISEGKLSKYDDFEDLKFLIRRATLLNSNILISWKMFSLLELLYSSQGLPMLEKKLTSAPFGESSKPGKNLFEKVDLEQRKEEAMEIELKKSALHDFHIFFSAQIKELLLLNESRAIKLEELIRNEQNKGELGYKQLINILRMENAIIIQQFYDFLETHDDWRKMEITALVEPSEVKDKPTIKAFLSKPQIENHYNYKVLAMYFKAAGQNEPKENDPFITYLWVKQFIKQEGKPQNPVLGIKTKSLFKALSIICKYTDETNQNIHTIGSFLIVKDTQGKPHLVHDLNSANRGELDKYQWENPDDSLLTTLLENVNDKKNSHNETILELGREHGEWVNWHATNAEDRKVKLSNEFLDSTLNRVIILKLSKRIGTEVISSGIAGFYFRAIRRQDSDIVRMQYLLLLQQSLNDFVEHNHQNNLFHEWLLAENKKRMVLLTGHGKEMLQAIYEHHPVFKNIPLHLGNLQGLIQLNDNIRYMGGESELKTKLQPFFDLNENTIVTQDYAVELKEWAQTIFDSPYIENETKVDITLDHTEAFQFALNKSIIDLICFELLINAKKNRWHFLPDDAFEGIPRNQLHISIKVTGPPDAQEMEIRISNTGPNVYKGAEQNVMRDLNNPSFNVKPDFATSGTALIKALVFEVLNGKKPQFTCDPIIDEKAPYFFTAKINFNEIKS